MERIIAKIDNDFNPDNSDWIPRVAAWTIDAMAILKVLQDITKTKKLDVKDRIAYDKCGFESITKVTDENGCIIEEAGSKSCCGNHPFTGDGKESDLIYISKTMATDREQDNLKDIQIAVETTKGNEPISHKIINIGYGGQPFKRNYVIVDCNKMELNYDAKYVIIEYKSIKTDYSETFGCDLPVIPNNGLLIECIVAWCMYKMLCRGYKHPVFNLRDNSPAINPFLFWNLNKDKAKDSVNADAQGDINTKLWRSSFFIETFDPRR